MARAKRKGFKKVRVAYTIKERNIDFVKEMADQNGESMSSFVDYLIDKQFEYINQNEPEKL